MKKLILGLFILGLTTQIYAQDPILTENLSEVYVVANYKYLSSVNASESAIPVEKLQLAASDFDIKDLDIYAEENEYYDVYFFIPQGKILAKYNEKGELLTTVERYRNTELPSAVTNEIEGRFPNWNVSKNVYSVNYHESGNSNKLYKITLENGNQKIRVKMDNLGNFK